jgi:hypothetical protein
MIKANASKIPFLQLSFSIFFSKNFKSEPRANWTQYLAEF